MNVEALKTERDRLREWIHERVSDPSTSSRCYTPQIARFKVIKERLMTITAEDMARRDTSNGYAFCCPLVGMYPCEQMKRGCYCHELHLINEHDRERRAAAYCRDVFAENVKFGGMP